MEIWGLILAGVLVLWIMIKLKSSRPDGVWLKDLHPYRYLMPFVMRGRNESVVYFELSISAKPLLEFVKQHPYTMTQVLVCACAQTLHQHPELNRFVAGRRVYQRNAVELSFSMKRVKLDKSSKVSVVKLAIPKDLSLAGLAEELERKISVERTDKRTHADKEYDLFSLLPVPLFDLFARLFFWCNDHNLLPASFMKEDGMFASAFIANLGSLNMSPGFHHLFEWGNCPIFMMAGKVEERVVARNGEQVIESILPLRISYDERINDGLSARYCLDTMQELLENPERMLH